MKKTLLTCMAILALFAFAGSLSAITCTVDQRPAATLLIPRFAVSLNGDSTIKRGTPDSVDTLIAIGNASAAPMLAHVNVFNSRSTLVLDFMVALTGFDIQTWRMSDAISGLLPSTPIDTSHNGPDLTHGDPSEDDACQRNPSAPVFNWFTSSSGYLRVRPPCASAIAEPPCLSTGQTADPKDNLLATSAYPVPAFQPDSPFAKQVIDSLDSTDDSLGCGDDTVDGFTSGNAVGYVTIDMANYCSISNPSDENYYVFNAMGNENNLYGDYIFLTGEGVATYGAAAVAIESDFTFNPGNFNARPRTFYARYWAPADVQVCQRCTGSGDANLLNTAPWDVGVGDQREPLGLRWAARYFTNSAVLSNFDVWRASARSLTDLTDGGDCDVDEPTPQLNFFDEDENGVSQIGPGPCPSPCTLPPPTTFNFPLETNQKFVTDFTLPPPEGALNAGWVEMIFANSSTGTELDQAYVGYQFNGGAAFISAHFPGIQLDPSACAPLDILNPLNGFAPVAIVPPTVPGLEDACTVIPCSPTTTRVGIGP